MRSGVPPSTESAAFNHGDATLMASSNPDRLSQALLLDTIVELSLHLLSTSQWGLNFNIPEPLGDTLKRYPNMARPKATGPEGPPTYTQDHGKGGDSRRMNCARGLGAWLMFRLSGEFN